MKTTGVVPEAFAASISLLSRSEMDPMPNSSRSQWKVIRPSEPTTSSGSRPSTCERKGRRSGAEAVAHHQAQAEVAITGRATRVPQGTVYLGN
jgi:hypothetical protein